MSKNCWSPPARCSGNRKFCLCPTVKCETGQAIEIVRRVMSMRLRGLLISSCHNCLAKCSWCGGVWQLKWHILLAVSLQRLDQSPGERK